MNSWSGITFCREEGLMTDISNASDLLEACFKYFVLGVVQGLTEFLPISSTAHLKIVPILIGWKDPGVSLTAVIQLGSILAVATYFRNDLKGILKGISLGIKNDQWKEQNARLGIAICTGTIPILLTGMSIKIFWKSFENSIFRSIHFIAIISILMAILLGLAEKNGEKKKDLKTVSGKDGFIIGIGQLFAILPGVSRSGVTLTTAMLYGWQREEAARFSFLLGLPAITFAGLAELKNTLNGPLQSSNEILPLMVGIFSSAIMSWLVIDWFLKYLQKNNTWVFVAYRLFFGLTLMIWWLGIPTNSIK